MKSFRSVALWSILAGIVAILSLPGLLGRTPASLASLRAGTDDAFAAEGLEPRENLVGGGAIRWTRPKALFRFEEAGPGSVDIEIEARDHRTEVTITANGARLGSLRPGERHFKTRTRLPGASLALALDTEGFAASGRTLGTQLVSLKVSPAPGTEASKPGAFPPRLVLTLGGLIVIAAIAQGASGLPALIIPAIPALFLLMVVPAGLWRSSWMIEAAVFLGASVIASALVAARAQGSDGARGWLQAALLAALTIHGVLPPSPLIVQGDVQLHGNKLGEVARGNFFPTSRTDHKPPFEIPYGFSFYATLAPFVSPDVSNVKVVREGAAFFSSLSILAMGLLLGRTSAGLAAGSLFLWTFAPVNLRTMAFGNLSNVFAQAVFVLFLVVAGGKKRGKGTLVILALLAALSATAHLSSFIVLAVVVLIAAILAEDRRSPAFIPLLCGVALAAAYFLTFLPMIASQVPRLLGERGGSGGVFDPWRLPAHIVSGLGWPFLLLLVIAAVFESLRALLPLTRSLAIAGVLLAVAALVSPVEVRYLLALVPVLAIAGGSVIEAPTRVATLFPFVLLAAVANGLLVLKEFLPLFST
jgi:hypothetical protein